MKKINNPYWLFSLGSLIIAGLFWYITYEYRYTNGNTTLRLIGMIGLIVFVVAAIVFLRMYLKRKPKKSYLSILGKAFMRVTRFFSKIGKQALNKLQFFKPRSYTKGSQTVSFLGLTDKEEKKRKRATLPKWKSLETNSQKARYIYSAFLLRAAKKNSAVIDSARTPIEQPIIKEQAPELAGIYCDARYSNGDISEEQLNAIMKYKQ